jgi:CBS domain-containing protein
MIRRSLWTDPTSRAEGATVKVRGILAAKGDAVETIQPWASVGDVVDRLVTSNIGVLVVTSGSGIEGTVSERDIVRALGKHTAADLAGMPVSEIMSRGVPVCAADDDLTEVMTKMTRGKVRHLPVLTGGELTGLISIGDAIATRLSEVELESAVLRDLYIAGR